MASKMKLRSGDRVVVIAGKDKGKEGKIIEVIPTDNAVVVEGVNIVSKHKKPKNAQDKGGIIKKENKIDASNVMIICPDCKKATRVGYAVNGDDKYRQCKKCGASLDKNVVVKKAAKSKDAKKDVKPVATKIDKQAPKKASAKAAKPVEKSIAQKAVKNTDKKQTTARTKTTAVRKTADKG